MFVYLYIYIFVYLYIYFIYLFCFIYIKNCIKLLYLYKNFVMFCRDLRIEIFEKRIYRKIWKIRKYYANIV